MLSVDRGGGDAVAALIGGGQTFSFQGVLLTFTFLAVEKDDQPRASASYIFLSFSNTEYDNFFFAGICLAVDS